MFPPPAMRTPPCWLLTSRLFTTPRREADGRCCRSEGCGPVRGSGLPLASVVARASSRIAKTRKYLSPERSLVLVDESIGIRGVVSADHSRPVTSGTRCSRNPAAIAVLLE